MKTKRTGTKTIFLLTTLLLSVNLVKAQTDFEQAVVSSLRLQMETYPQMTLKDLYKSFFQDRFGSGHLLEDTLRVADYLRNELDLCTDTPLVMVEPIGWQHNFYRVNLAAVKNGLLPFDVLLYAFIRSGHEVNPEAVDQWRKEWASIEQIICSLDLHLPNYKQDSKEISKKLAAGTYVGHHSQVFRDNYAPRYRIVSKEIFEQEIKPLMDKNKGNKND